MQIKFEPKFHITPKIVNNLLLAESVKEKILHLPLTPLVLNSLRESSKLYTTHYSTMIEGNQLLPDQIEAVLKHKGHFPGRARDEGEVKGYYGALEQVEKWASSKITITENMIQILHAIVMNEGKSKVTPSRYRDGQNVIRDSITRAIIYLPPESKDVKNLMHAMVTWINQNTELACPIVAAIAHYQFATIHPYYDGNGRCARLLTTLILHLGGYDLKGLYSLEEYYARNLGAYYEAISIGESHNYYMGRAQSDITSWIEYFIEGMRVSFERVLARMQEYSSPHIKDQSNILKTLDPRQRKVLELFTQHEAITAKQIGDLFGFKPRTSALLCSKWVDSNFLEIIDFSNKGRKYKLAQKYHVLLT